MADSAINRLLSRLKQLRRERGLTQEAFAESCGLSYKYYQALETGRKRNLRLVTVDKLAKALQMDVSAILAPVSPSEKAKVAKSQR